MDILHIDSQIKDNKIVINIPPDFSAKEVEVIIKKKKKIKSNLSWQDDLKSVSVWDIKEEDIKIKSWKIEDY